MALLEARGLVKRYGRRTVVSGVDLDVREGEIVGLLGPNGAGKTTSFRSIAGMITPNEGRITFAGKNITGLPMYQRARLGLGYLPQNHSYFRRLTVEQNLMAILELMTTRRGMPYRSNRKQKLARADELLSKFGLQHIRKNIADNCSGGEKRRLEIARCLITEPMLIMLDEPFTGIDPITVADIQNIIRSLKDDGISVLITDHHVAETLRITDRSYLIAAGKMLSHGSPTEILNDQKAREVYLGENFSVHLHAPPPASAAPNSAPMPPSPVSNPGAGVGEKASTSPPSEASSLRPASVRSLFEQEDLIALVARLADADAPEVAQEILDRGLAAVPALLIGLERNHVEIRRRSHELLVELLQLSLPYDANAEESLRRRQVASIRSLLQPRRAG